MVKREHSNWAWNDDIGKLAKDLNQAWAAIEELQTLALQAMVYAPYPKSPAKDEEITRLNEELKESEKNLSQQTENYTWMTCNYRNASINLDNTLQKLSDLIAAVEKFTTIKGEPPLVVHPDWKELTDALRKAKGE
jgi:hypothetical protein